MESENGQSIDPITEMLMNDGIIDAEEQINDNPEEQEEEYQEQPDSEEETDEDDLGEDPEEYEEEPSPEDDEEPEAENFVEINGEQVPLDELKNGYLRQADYTRKTQELADKKASLSALEGFGQIMAQDPQKAAQIMQIMRGEPVQAPEQKTPQFDDPIDQLRWEIKEELRRDMQKELDPKLRGLSEQQQAIRKQSEVQQALASFQQDPDFDAVRAQMAKTVESLPGHIERDVQGRVIPQKSYGPRFDTYVMLDSDPDSFAQMYADTKKSLTARQKAGKTIPKKKGSPRLANQNGNAHREPTQKQMTRKEQQAALASKDVDKLFDILVRDKQFGNVFE